MNVNERFADFVLNPIDHDLYIHIGGYGSSKSHGISQKLLLTLAREKRKAIVVRRYYNSHKESTYALLVSIANEFFMPYIKSITKSPLSIQFKNGSEIIFRGLDNPETLKSIADVSLAWVEESSEVNVDGFREIIGRMRSSEMRNTIILSTNPISHNNWMYSEFFGDDKAMDEADFYKYRTLEFEYGGMKGIAYHSTVDDNKFVPDDYKARLDGLKDTDPYLYEVARWGRFGVLGNRVFDLNRIHEFDDKNIVSGKEFRGGDLGFSISYNAFVRCYVDDRLRRIYITDEVYNNDITNQELAEILKAKGLADGQIFVDLAEPKTIRELNVEGIPAVVCRKENGNKIQGVKKIKNYEIWIHESCKQYLNDFKTLTYYKDRQGVTHEERFNFDCHTLDGLIYAMSYHEPAFNSIKHDYRRTKSSFSYV